MQYAPPKCWISPTRLHGLVTENTIAAHFSVMGSGFFNLPKGSLLLMSETGWPQNLFDRVGSVGNRTPVFLSVNQFYTGSELSEIITFFFF